ncbi:hypothetical protein D0962_23300 [Leptolyngbyaceae cyanobacterium CCMR0082]|uniref:Uncharacterized protein n=1 Tax=Adonisia turfae CCMR0082 TaxID=2304604 RepID=A0A6M0SBF6_9CYAN|nr:hypothetical protein [Adonisia turfae]NEZ65646.1 hypothetical protein [Adonisia turfae CCMR0082]
MRKLKLDASRLISEEQLDGADLPDIVLLIGGETVPEDLPQRLLAEDVGIESDGQASLVLINGETTVESWLNAEAAMKDIRGIQHSLAEDFGVVDGWHAFTMWRAAMEKALQRQTSNVALLSLELEPVSQIIRMHWLRS